ncbi:MAG: hypothetical protein EXR72_26225 [Myxococcales bacterium]|nr:hypothetical protein [Myxococcales bacterium]
MQLILETPTVAYRAGEKITVRALLLNDSFEPVVIDARLLVGPNVRPQTFTGIPYPVSVEPPLPDEAEHFITLNPWCFFGRQRSFERLPAGQVTFHAYLVSSRTDGLLPDRPADGSLLLASAAPLVVTVESA